MELPWVEKYRPDTLADLISHADICKTITKFIDQGRLPHLLFYGPPGTGKTTTILAASRALYHLKERSSMVLELNASDARGINVVREQILNFASTKTLFTGKFKLIILDEADSMTKDAQNALRRIIEKFTANTRFCLICNYLSKVIPAIQSRCSRFRFPPVSYVHMYPRLKEIADLENVNITEDGIKALYRFAAGDMRKSINLLQSASMSASLVNESAVYACVAYPSPEEIRSLVDLLLNETVKSAYDKIMSIKTLKGIALQDILTELHPIIMKIDFPDAVRIELLIALSDIEHRMSTGSSERLQLGALVGKFAIIKSQLKTECT